MVMIYSDIETRIKGFKNFAQLLTDVDIKGIPLVKLEKIYESLAWQFEKDFAERKKPAIEAIKYMQEAKYADFEEIIKMINRI